MWSSNVNNSESFGGGFLNSSRKTDQDDVKLRRIQTLFPVMIKHLNDAPSTEGVAFWGIPARMFTFLGIVRNIEETPTKISYDIEDQTGTITALKWLEADKKVSDHTIKVNSYVRITGLLRSQNETRHILILRMWPLTNLNELTNHLLEVTFVITKAAAMAKKGKELENQTAASGADGIPSEDTPYYGMTADQTLVYKIINTQNDTDTGISRSEVKAKVPKSILAQTDQILDFLVSEGHIFTTCTDDHFKTT